MNHVFIPLFLSLWLFECNEGNGGMDVRYYISGKRSDVTLGSSEVSRVRKAAILLIEGSDDRLSVYVGKDRREQMLRGERVVEIILPSVTSVSTTALGMQRVKRILLPITGDFGVNDPSTGAIFLLGEDQYLSTPLGNSKGEPLVREILDIIEGARAREQGEG